MIEKLSDFWSDVSVTYGYDSALAMAELSSETTDDASLTGLVSEATPRLNLEIDRLTDSVKLDILASACSDLIRGGESGWENMKFDDFVSLVRKNIGGGRRLFNKI